MVPKKFDVEASPSKEFFINMLTRDISLIDCILDLIDNSIDSIIGITKFDPMRGLFGKEKISLEKYRISMHFSKEEFIIEDDSAGVSKDDVQNNIFHFGSVSQKENKTGLSVYGIGMKRAFLKMGKNIIFESTTKKEKIKVDIDVLKWKEEATRWEFKGEAIAINKKKVKTGTKIKIINLYDNIGINFDNEAFKTKLIEKISEVYGIFLLNKLNIEINGSRAKPIIPRIVESKLLKAAIATVEKKDVKIKIIAGITHENYKKLNGWYIFCNGRLILSGDTTDKTGWGEGDLRKFHPSVARFVGFVYFESKKVEQLPWTTTKDGVNFDSSVYQYALNEMVKVAQPIVAYLAKSYTADKKMEKINKVVEDAEEISLETLNKSTQEFKHPPIEEQKKDDVSEKIIYNVPGKDLKKAKEIMGDKNITNAKVGEKTFYHFLEYES